MSGPRGDSQFAVAFCRSLARGSAPEMRPLKCTAAPAPILPAHLSLSSSRHLHSHPIVHGPPIDEVPAAERAQFSRRPRIHRLPPSQSQSQCPGFDVRGRQSTIQAPMAKSREGKSNPIPNRRPMAFIGGPWLFSQPCLGARDRLANRSMEVFQRSHPKKANHSQLGKAANQLG
jgi:hypothetical protein